MSTRKSARLTAKAEAAASTPVQHPAPRQQPRKKQKTALNIKSAAQDDKNVVARTNYSRVKGKRGQLQVVTEMPLDILLEIFSNLEPVNLLHLSRVSKSLRNILTSNNTAYIWKLAYENLPVSLRPPACPNGVSIIHYTNYIYGRHCQFCSSVYGRLCHDSALVRLCHKCIGVHTLSWPVRETELSTLCSNWGFRRVRGQHILRVEYIRRQQELAKAKKSKKSEEYIRLRKAEVQSRNLHGHAIDRWRLNIRREQDRNTQNILREREEQIWNRLQAEGGTTNFNRWFLWRVPHVRKVKELTDSEWQHIRADIIDYLQDDYEARQTAEMTRNFSSKIYHLSRFLKGPLNNPTPLIVPGEYYIASLEPISSYLKNANVLLRKVEFVGFRPQILEIVDKWRKETDEYLLTLIPSSSSKKRKGKSHKGKEKELTNPLELAATFFKCYSCTEPISYPRILAHRCLSHLVKPDEVQEDQEVNEQDDGMSDLGEEDEGIEVGAPREPRPRQPIDTEAVWKSFLATQSTGIRAGNSFVTFDEEAHGVARNMIQLCGEDPDTATKAVMQENDKRLECLRCRSSQRKRLVMNWTTAILHELEEHYGEDLTEEPVWKLVDSQDMDKIKDAEFKVAKKRKTAPLFCKHCGDPYTPFAEAHLYHAHRLTVEKSKVPEHFYEDFDAPMKRAPHAVRI